MQICAERLAIGASSSVKDKQAAGKLLLASQLLKGLCAAGKVLQAVQQAVLLYRGVLQ